MLSLVVASNRRKPCGCIDTAPLFLGTACLLIRPVETRLVKTIDSRQLKEQKEDQIENKIHAVDPWLESDPWQTALKALPTSKSIFCLGFKTFFSQDCPHSPWAESRHLTRSLPLRPPPREVPLAVLNNLEGL